MDMYEQNKQQLPLRHQRVQLQTRQRTEAVQKNEHTLEFVYMREEPDVSGDSNPYTLIIVDHTDVSPRNYYTLSAAGVTHFLDDDAQFTSLDQWKRERQHFQRLKEIALFRQHRLWKAFFVWKRNVRSAILHVRAGSLQERLFLLNPILSRSLLEIRRRTLAIRDERTLSFQTATTYTLEALRESHGRLQGALEAQVQQLRRTLAAIVRDACTAVLANAGFNGPLQHSELPGMPDNKFTSADTSSGDIRSQGRGRYGAEGSGAPPANAQGKDALSPVPSRRMTYTELAAQRAECRRLTRFTVLCDFMLVDSLFSIAVESELMVNKRLLSLRGTRGPSAAVPVAGGFGKSAEPQQHSQSHGLEPDQSRSTIAHTDITDADDVQANVIVPTLVIPQPYTTGEAPLIEAGIGIRKDQVCMLPSAAQVRESLGAIRATGLSILRQITSLVEDDEIRTITQTGMTADFDGGADVALGPSLSHLLGSSEFQSLVERVDREIEGGLQLAQEFLTLFTPLVSILSANATVSEADMLAAARDGSRDLQSFEHDIVRYKTQLANVDAMEPRYRVGTVMLVTRPLREILRPSPLRCLDNIDVVLPALAAEKNHALVEELAAVCARLASQPSDVHEFITYQENLYAAKRRQPELQSAFQTVTSYYNTMERYRISVSDEERAAFNSAAPAYARLATQLQNAEDSADDKISQFSPALETLINNFNADVVNILDESQQDLFSRADTSAEDGVAKASYLRAQVRELDEMAAQLRRAQELFRREASEFENLERAKTSVNLIFDLFHEMKSWEDRVVAWRATRFGDVDAASATAVAQQALKVCLRYERAMESNPCVTEFKLRIQSFKGILPLVTDLSCTALMERHWDRIEEILGTRVVTDQGALTLGQLIDIGGARHRDAISAIAGQASAEKALEELLQKVVTLWHGVEFECQSYGADRGVGTFILTAVDDIVAQLEESHMTVQTVLGSRHVAPIEARAKDMDEKLTLFSDTLDEWLACQRNWVYLVSIFSAPDISKQLPAESRSFAAVDRMWRELMQHTADNPAALRAATAPGLRDKLRSSNETLERVQKKLEEYLETKRVAFPRFYFLSNDELLEILAHAKDPQAVQPHLRKCFDGLDRLAIDHPGAAQQEPRSHIGSNSHVDIVAMISEEEERVEFTKAVKARGNVEAWLLAVEQAMVASLRRHAKTALASFEKERRNQWIFEHAAMLSLTVSQVMWSRDVEACICDSSGATSALERFLNETRQQLAGMAGIVRQPLSKLQRRSIGAIITIDVHARDIVEEMIAEKVSSLGDFGWKKRLRYYWETGSTGEDCFVRQVEAETAYGYEYLGASPRLVITPLTDRCYITLMGAMSMKLGGAPAGPAGTGKTETTKDLAKAVARQCVVYNCSESVDFKMMGRFFSGLAQAGAWACFDEFNRIDIEVLSVIAQQVLTVQTALRAGASRVMFEGSDIRLLPTFGVFITMNPGYAGRTELPDNLKALFRPVSMMIPNYALIAEIMLFSEGFESSKSLSEKMVKLYKLCSEQLSQQDHYDFGMRAVKSVLVMAGALKRTSPELDEAAVLIRAMRDANLPKFLADDTILFENIISDLFPGVEIPASPHGSLQDAIEEETLALRLQAERAFTGKVVQLFDTLTVRFGVMLVGPTGGGKSMCTTVLANALGRLAALGHANGADIRAVERHSLNPKAVTMGELYGETNALTQEWHDGIASTIVRDCVRSNTDTRKWVVFDGPVDALWIENMNTVLDDNRTLCLASGERIKLNDSMNMVFEVEDLAVASPATVSRCGMVYMTPADLGWRAPVTSWLQRLRGGTPAHAQTRAEEQSSPTYSSPRSAPISNTAPVYDGAADERKNGREAHAEYPGIPSQQALDHTRSPLPGAVCDHLAALCERAIPSGLSFLRDACHEAIPSVDPNIVATLCCIVEALLVRENAVDLSGSEDTVRRVTASVFVFAYTWSFGANISAPERERFDDHARRLFADEKLPADDLLFDWRVDVASGTFEPWTALVPSFAFDPNAPFFSMIVPTVDTVRYTYLMQIAMRNGRGVLLNGESGTGKTAIASKALADASHDEQRAWVPIIVNFSAQTSSEQTQAIIESKLTKHRKTVFGAPPGKRVAIFVDDVNMPTREVYGAQPPVELLRQLLDYSGFFDREKIFWKSVQDVTVLAACGPPGGGRNPVTPRFFRHLSMLHIAAPCDNVLQHIFEALLGGFLSRFPSDIRSLCRPAVLAAIQVYRACEKELLPTPAKSHYTFNLRDLSSVFQGMLQATPRVVSSPGALAELWAHETARVFHDRLVSSNDRSFFLQLVADTMQRHFGVRCDADELFSGDTPLLFASFMNPGADEGERVYERIQSLDKVEQVLQDYLEEYNTTSSGAMHLVFFRDAVEHLARVYRIITQPRGNAMLVGVGGSGRQSLTRLACAMAGFRCFQIELRKGYSVSEFHEDLKELFQIAGVQNTPVVFLFSDTQIVNEGFLEDINNVLNAGEVPNLFAPDERAKLLNDLRTALGTHQTDSADTDAMDSRNDDSNVDTPDALYGHFVRCVRDNLHIVLCMSPVGDSFRVRCRQFPSLINCCTIDWYDPWPRDALYSVAKQQLLQCDDLEDDRKMHLAELCVEAHLSITGAADAFYAELRRHVYTTPKSYLDLIRLYTTMLGQRKTLLSKKRDRFVLGLQKLTETNETVDSLKQELQELEPVLERKSRDVSELIQKLEVDQARADQVKQSVQADEAIVSAQAEQCRAIQSDAQRDLDEALPALEAAVSALNALDKKSITEMKSFAKPPRAVEFVMEAVGILLGEKKLDWDASKKLLADTQFLSRLQAFDKDNIPEARIKKLRRYVEDPDFDPKVVESQSVAAKSLCLWCRAMDIYHKVALNVEPKRQKLREANAMLEEAQEKLRGKQEELATVERELGELKRQFASSSDEKRSLQNRQEQTARRLKSAEKLTALLADEHERWAREAERLDGEISRLVGDVFVASAVVAYAGPFTAAYRERLVGQWLQACRARNIPVSEGFALRTVLSDPVEVRDFAVTGGLPTDSLSVDNAILVRRTSRWPLMIDPQGQANRWVRNTEARHSLKVVKLTSPNYLRVMENAIRIGTPVLLEDVGEELDPALEPILAQQVFTQGGRQLIRIGDSDVEYDPNFRLYLTTKLANPHYLPETCIKVTIVNFTVTLAGLEDQLLADVVRKERPDLEEQRDNLVVSMASDRKQLQDLESKILRLLSESEGNILDDTMLIQTLNDSKLTSGVINERVKEAAQNEASINEAREGYRPVAGRGSLLYFIMADLAAIDPMYQYSLEFFKHLFSNVLEGTPKASALRQRLAILIDAVTRTVYANVSRGLFEVHKAIFTFLIASRVARSDGVISNEEWSLFLRGDSSAHAQALEGLPDAYEAESDSSTTGESRPAAATGGQAWPGSEAIHVVAALEKLHEEDLRGLTASLQSDAAAWKVFASANNPYLATLPPAVTASLSLFQRLLLVRALCPEKLMFAIPSFVQATLGDYFAEPPPFDLESVYSDSSTKTPIVFILSTGADPTGLLLRFARENDYAARLRQISLGQGQGPVAEREIKAAAANGDWVLLQNCHLARSWMVQLEALVAELQQESEDVHPDFRLWLTSMPSPSFPVSVLQNGIKLTNEPPKGLRANMKRSFNNLHDHDLETTSAEPQKWRRLLYSLASFHGIIQERRKFGPVGWNIRYEFNDSDFETAMGTLRLFFESHESLPWEAVLYVTGVINYGGRVTDDWDLRCLQCILERYYHPSVFDPSFVPGKDPSYRIPSYDSLDDVRHHIDTLPFAEQPEVFGLDKNAEIIFQKQESSRMLGTVLEIEPRVGTGAGAAASEESILARAAEMEAMLPSEISLEEAGATSLVTSESGILESLDVVLKQEIERFNTLLSVVRSSLQELQRAIKGLVVMSAELDQIYVAIDHNKVPSKWAKAAYPSMKSLASWMEDLLQRIAMLRAWLQNGEPTSFWLPGFFYPQGFLTGVLQRYARKHRVPIDSLSFSFEFTNLKHEEVSSMPDEGVYVHGLFLEGASWNVERSILEEAKFGQTHAVRLGWHWHIG